MKMNIKRKTTSITTLTNGVAALGLSNCQLGGKDEESSKAQDN